MIQQSPWRVVCEAFLTHVLRSFDEIYQEWNSLLQALLDDLLSDALPDDWRERLDQFLAQTEALGLEIPPDSIRALEELIESHARGADKQVIDNPAERVANRIADQEEVIEPSRPPVIAGLPTPGHRSGQSHNFNAQPLFDERLKSAGRHFTIMSQLLEVLGEKLDAAKPGEEVDVDYEVGRIIEHLRLYNDDLEAARYLWLHFQLPDEALSRLHGMLTPVALGLPPYFDEAQATRDRQQTADIGRKLKRRTGDLDSQISTLQTIDKVGTAAGFLAGGGTLVNIAKKGGKFVVLKTIAAIATAGAGYVADQWIEGKLREKGVSDQTLRGVRLAAAVVSFILLRRASRRAARIEEPVVDEANSGASKGGFESPPESPVSQGEPSNASGDIELRPYGGKGGGHHVGARRAFEGTKGFDADRALAIPNRELARLNIKHTRVTTAQRKLYSAFAKTGKQLTWDAVQDIETSALVAGGAEPGQAAAAVQTAIQALKDSGVAGPIRIPWGGRNAEAGS